MRCCHIAPMFTILGQANDAVKVPLMPFFLHACAKAKAARLVDDQATCSTPRDLASATMRSHRSRLLPKRRMLASSSTTTAFSVMAVRGAPHTWRVRVVRHQAKARSVLGTTIGRPIACGTSTRMRELGLNSLGVRMDASPTGTELSTRVCSWDGPLRLRMLTFNSQT